MLQAIFLWGKLEEHDPQELKQDFMAGNFNKTVMAGVSIVKNEVDSFGKHILEDGRQTVEALKELECDFHNACSKLNHADDGDLQVNMPQALVKVFQDGLPVDVYRYQHGYDRLTHLAFETSRHEVESNKFEPHQPVAWLVFIVSFAAFQAQSWLVIVHHIWFGFLFRHNKSQVSKLACD